LCNQANGYSILLDGALGCAGENPLTTGDEWIEGEDVLLSIKCRFCGKDLWIAQLNSVDDLEDPALCQDLRDYI